MAGLSWTYWMRAVLARVIPGCYSVFHILLTPVQLSLPLVYRVQVLHLPNHKKPLLYTLQPMFLNYYGGYAVCVDTSVVFSLSAMWVCLDCGSIYCAIFYSEQELQHRGGRGTRQQFQFQQCNSLLTAELAEDREQEVSGEPLKTPNLGYIKEQVQIP